jgi:hypothetical protein
MNRSFVRPALRLVAAVVLIGFVGAAPVFANENDRDDSNTVDSGEELVAPGAVKRPVKRTRPGQTAPQAPVVIAPEPRPQPPVVVAPQPRPEQPVVIAPRPRPPVTVEPDDNDVVTGIRPVRPARPMIIDEDEGRDVLMTRREIVRVLYRNGYEAISPIRRRGAVYITEAVGPHGERVRLVIDAFSGDIEGRRLLTPSRVNYTSHSRRWAGWEIED